MFNSNENFSTSIVNLISYQKAITKTRITISSWTHLLEHKYSAVSFALLDLEDPES